MESIDSRLLYLDIPVNSEAEEDFMKNSVSSSSSRTSVTKFKSACLNFRVKTFTSKQECTVVTNFNDSGFFDTLWFAEFRRPVDFFSFHKQLVDAVESLSPDPRNDPTISSDNVSADKTIDAIGNYDINIKDYADIYKQHGVSECEFSIRKSFHFDDIAKHSPFRFGPNLRSISAANEVTDHINSDFINHCYKHLNKFLNSKVTTKLHERSKQTRTRKALENISSVMNRITNQELSKLYSTNPVKCENYGYMLSIYYKQFLRVMYDKINQNLCKAYIAGRQCMNRMRNYESLVTYYKNSVNIST
ncbi:hypothetical protein BEWA_042900 [Theileria equi strain WA]|uniref:Uncharacterized protein n=1 Tax=Theileria equi strain WA TaxID=1537102 RepID=L1LG70_THEEQ|nr:hypothetical protein BEWA_042900 [Theileria equi strain WA]EKX74249.1 hypothetical protein BEWA_042900 [Theileria equi strain WA]|eukprot:XP_004833701.1 hypothetical protein BEWA_042900 [Theileria equi strain WA]